MNEHELFLRHADMIVMRDGMAATYKRFTAAADEIKRLEGENRELAAEVVLLWNLVSAYEKPADHMAAILEASVDLAVFRGMYWESGRGE